ILTLPLSPLFPYTTLFRSLYPCKEFLEELPVHGECFGNSPCNARSATSNPLLAFDSSCISSILRVILRLSKAVIVTTKGFTKTRSEEHTSELQSLRHLVCR